MKEPDAFCEAPIEAAAEPGVDLHDQPECSAWLADGTITAETGRRCGIIDGDFPVRIDQAGRQMSPIMKGYKRILYGIENSVQSFYDPAILFADGRLGR